MSKVKFLQEQRGQQDKKWSNSTLGGIFSRMGIFQWKLSQLLIGWTGPDIVKVVDSKVKVTENIS